MFQFSFLLPTRDRPHLVERFFQSIIDTADSIERIEVILCLDEDDLESQNISGGPLSVREIVLPRGSTMGSLSRCCFGASSGRYVILINDDVIIRTKHWDGIVSKALSVYQDDIALIHINDLLFRQNLCTFPILSRKTCSEIGVCPAGYRKYRIDDHIYDTYQMLAYLGHICGPYEMTFRLVNAGKQEVWHQEELLYHVWHPGQAGSNDFLGPHDGQHMSTTALQSRFSKRVLPFVENPSIRILRLKQKDVLQEGLISHAVSKERIGDWATERLRRRGGSPRKLNLVVAKNIIKNRLKSLWNGHQIG
jgi:hypothetical protein